MTTIKVYSFFALCAVKAILQTVKQSIKQSI